MKYVLKESLTFTLLIQIAIVMFYRANMKEHLAIKDISFYLACLAFLAIIINTVSIIKNRNNPKENVSFREIFIRLVWYVIVCVMLYSSLKV